MSTRKYNFSAKVWLWPGETPWHFVSVSKEESAEIVKLQTLRQAQGKKRRGFGAVKVRVTVGPTSPRLRGASKTTWSTSIFPDKKSESYLLPLKAAVRKKEGIMAGDIISCVVRL